MLHDFDALYEEYKKAMTFRMHFGQVRTWKD